MVINRRKGRGEENVGRDRRRGSLDGDWEWDTIGRGKG